MALRPHAEPAERQAPATAAEWREEAAFYVSERDWTRAVYCYRKVSEFAPFSPEIRKEFEWVLHQQAKEAVARSRPLRSQARMDELDSTPEQESAPSREEPRRRASSAGARRRAPAARKSRFPYGLVAAAAIAVAVVAGGLYAATLATEQVREWLSSSSVVTLEDAPQELRDGLDSAARLAANKNMEGAGKQYQKLLAEHEGFESVITPVHEAALQAAGAAERKAAKLDAAANHFRTAAGLVPENPVNWIELADTLREQARGLTKATSASKREKLLVEAEQAYEQALLTEPTNTEAIYGLGQVFTARNDRRRAAESFERVVALGPETREGKLASRSLAELKKR